MAKTAWGIELGTSSVKAVRISGDRGNATLEEVEILSLRDFGQTNNSSHDAATTAALADLRSRKGIKRGDQVFVSISGQNTLGRIISLPPVSDDRIRETILNEARSQIPIKLEEAVWDYQVIEDADPDERKVNLYAAKKEAVDKIVQVCESAGLQVTGIQVAPLGIYNYIKYEMDDAISDCCVAIDIGADNTDVILIDGQKTYVRVVPVAGNDITKALRIKFKLPADQAEKLKRNAAKSKEAPAVFEAMKPPLKEMVGEIYRAVGFYKSQNEEANINQLVMMGNGSKLLNIKKFFEQQLQYQVHKVEAPQRLALMRTVDPTEVQSTIQSLTVAIGLALQGLGVDGLNRINLIPPDYITAKATEKLRMPFFVGGGIAAAGGLIALVIAILATSGIDPLLSSAEAVTSSGSSQQSEYTTAVNPDDEVQRRARSLENLNRLQLAEIPARKGTDADGNEIDLPARPLTVVMGAMPGMMLESLHASTQRYLAEGNLGADKPRIYYASLQSSGAPNLSSKQTAMTWMEMEADPTTYIRTPGEEQIGIFAPKYTLNFHAYLASELYGGDAYNSSQAVVKLLAPVPQSGADQLSEGLLRQELRTRLMSHFETTGQLDNLTQEDRAAIRFTGINLVARFLSGGDNNRFPLRDIVQQSNRWDTPTGQMQSPRQQATGFFAATDLHITLELKGIAPPPEGQ